MMMPSVAEERADALARKYERFAPRLRTQWRSNGLLVSLLFFGLTILAVVACFAFFHLGGFPKGWLTAALAIGVAEWLIHRRRFFGTGVESALWVGGLFAFIFGLPGEGKPEALLLFAIAALIAGARVRNAWLVTLAAILVVAYFNVKDMRGAALMLALAITIASTLALMREWQRPSTERLFATLVVAMPIVGAIAGPPLDAGWSLLWFALSAAVLVAALRLRHHALLLSAFVSFVVGALAINDAIALRDEWKLLIAGAVLLATASIVMRRLRGRTQGIVLDSSSEESTEILATVQLSPTVEAAPGQRPGGGSFGGAGASGEF
jgi:MFS family permease